MTGLSTPGPKERGKRFIRIASIPAHIERWWPYAVSLGFAAVFAIHQIQSKSPSSLAQAIAPHALTVVAILLGFQGTSLAILLSITHEPLIERLRKSGDMSRLLGYQRAAVVGLFITVILSIAVLGWNAVVGAKSDLSDAGHAASIVTAISTSLFTGMVAFAISASVRTTALVLKLLDHL